MMHTSQNSTFFQQSKEMLYSLQAPTLYQLSTEAASFIHHQAATRFGINNLPNLPAIIAFAPISIYHTRGTNNTWSDFSKDFIKQSLPFLAMSATIPANWLTITSTGLNVGYNILLPYAPAKLTVLKDHINTLYSSSVDVAVEVTTYTLSALASTTLTIGTKTFELTSSIITFLDEVKSNIGHCAYSYISPVVNTIRFFPQDCKKELDKAILTFKKGHLYRAYDEKFCQHLDIGCDEKQQKLVEVLPPLNQKWHDLYTNKTFTPVKALGAIITEQTIFAGSFWLGDKITLGYLAKAGSLITQAPYIGKIFTPTLAGAAIYEGTKLYIESTNPDSENPRFQQDETFPYKEFIKDSINSALSAAALSYAPMTGGVFMAVYYTHYFWPDLAAFKKDSFQDLKKSASYFVDDFLNLEDQVASATATAIVGIANFIAHPIASTMNLIGLNNHDSEATEL